MIPLKRVFIISLLFLTPFIQGEQKDVTKETTPLSDISKVDSKDSKTFIQPDEEVFEDLEEEDQLFDIRPEVKLPHHALFYTLITLLGISVLLFIRALIRKWRNKQTKLEIISLSPYAKALQGLDMALEHIHQKDKKPFAFGITDSVRQYLSEVFDLPAPESTTEEVLEKLTNVNDLNEDLKGAIDKLLKSCDLAKFTQQEFDYQMRLNLYHQAKEIIQESDKSLQQKRVANSLNKETHANV